MSPLISSLDASLTALARQPACICVAFSGGLDSSALLHGLAKLQPHPSLAGLRAIHVHHGLHADADDWARHCKLTADALGIEYQQLSVSLAEALPGGLEAAARDARYQALRAALRPGEVLATAHHLDDQAETLLLRLMRGSGNTGLAGIPAWSQLGAGWLWRPLLALPRQILRDYCEAESLSWCEDPSNADTRHERNYIRGEILPALRQRWPAASQSIAHSAALLRESAELLDQLASQDLCTVQRGQRLDCTALADLGAARGRNLLRYFLRLQGLQAPGASRLAEGYQQLLGARPDAEPVMRFNGGELRRYRGQLYLLTAAPRSTMAEIPWDGRGVLDLGDGESFRLNNSAAGGLQAEISQRRLAVRYRRGGERLRRPGQAHHQALKKLLQAAGIPPWMRPCIPLLYADDCLVAVADLWLSAEAMAPAGEAGLQPHWDGHPPLQ